MKRLTYLVCALTILSMTILPIGAEKNTHKQVAYSVCTTEQNEEITIKTTLIVYEDEFRTIDKHARKVKEILHNGNAIAEVTLDAWFQYDGKTVQVTDTDSSHLVYDRWSYGSESIRTNGGTASLSARLTKTGNSAVAVSLSVSCSPTGSIT